MKLNNYMPIFRQVLFREVVQEKTTSGLFLPSKDMNITTYDPQFNNEKTWSGENAKLGDYVVVKAASDCLHVKEGDVLLLMDGARTTKIDLEEGEFFQIMEQQIIGISR